MLDAEQYYPCLYSTEQEACRVGYSGSLYPVIFGFPASIIDAHYDASPVDFPTRREIWAGMFGFIRTTVEVMGLPDLEVYLDPNSFILQWALYDPINGGTDDTHCRQNEYSNV